MDELDQEFPARCVLRHSYDITRSSRLSIKEVVKTLAEATARCLSCVLQSWRPRHPTVAVPVSLIGTFIGLYALGF
jgi:HAE1 family hydrophobic/amphiphilic exporter-1/multidrug efflux pump